MAFYLVFGSIFTLTGVVLSIVLYWYIGIGFIFAGLYCAIFGPIITRKKIGCTGCKMANFTPAEM